MGLIYLFTLEGAKYPNRDRVGLVPSRDVQPPPTPAPTETSLTRTRLDRDQLRLRLAVMWTGSARNRCRTSSSCRLQLRLRPAITKARSARDRRRTSSPRRLQLRLTTASHAGQFPPTPAPAETSCHGEPGWLGTAAGSPAHAESSSDWDWPPRRLS